jgi:mannose-6-phosphate isomerase-like protein (cupin superfamily)
MKQDKFLFDTRQPVRYRFPTHVNDLVMDRADAEVSEVFIVVIEPGKASPLHVHHDTEQIFYVLDGNGSLQIGDSPERHPLNPGLVARIPPHTFHRSFCNGDKPLRYLSVDCFLGGKSKEEPTWDSHVRTVCAQNGWEFDKVKAGN